MKCSLCGRASVYPVAVSLTRQILMCKEPNCTFFENVPQSTVPSLGRSDTIHVSDTPNFPTSHHPTSTATLPTSNNSLPNISLNMSFGLEDVLNDSEQAFVDNFIRDCGLFSLLEAEKGSSVDSSTPKVYFLHWEMPAFCVQHAEFSLLLPLILHSISLQIHSPHLRRIREVYKQTLLQALRSPEKSITPLYKADLDLEIGHFQKSLQCSQFSSSVSSSVSERFISLFRAFISQSTELKARFSSPSSTEWLCEFCSFSWQPCSLSDPPFLTIDLNSDNDLHLSRTFTFFKLCETCQLVNRTYRVTYDRLDKAVALSFPNGLPNRVDLDKNVCIAQDNLYCTMLLCQSERNPQEKTQGPISPEVWLWLRHHHHHDLWVRLFIPAPKGGELLMFKPTPAELLADMAHVRMALLEYREASSHPGTATTCPTNPTTSSVLDLLLPPSAPSECSSSSLLSLNTISTAKTTTSFQLYKEQGLAAFQPGSPRRQRRPVLPPDDSASTRCSEVSGRTSELLELDHRGHKAASISTTRISLLDSGSSLDDARSLVSSVASEYVGDVDPTGTTASAEGGDRRAVLPPASSDFVMQRFMFSQLMQEPSHQQSSSSNAVDGGGKRTAPRNVLQEELRRKRRRLFM